MLTSRKKKGLAALAVSALALGLFVPMGTAGADAAPGGADIVGVGSDTLQYMLDFGADGDQNGNPGYNASKLARVFSIDATPDANARAGYLNGSSNLNLLPLNPTVVLRAGTAPVQRPNGSGAGLAALIADTGSPETINFVRSSSAPASPGAGIDVVRLAHENVQVATATTTNAPILSKQQLFAIYECTKTTWTQVGGTSGDTILPIVPQPGSGTRKTFLQDIGFTVNGAGVATPALGSCVRTDEENNPYALYLNGDDPTTVTPVADPYATTAVANPDAIEPFSQARLNLYASGYFFNPNVTFGNPPPSGDEGVLSPTVKLDTGATPTTNASDGNVWYFDERGLYVFFRDIDYTTQTSTTHFNGSTKNWVQTLFYNGPSGNPFFKSGAGQTLLASAGVDPDYAFCGTNPASATGCGPFGP